MQDRLGSFRRLEHLYVELVKPDIWMICLLSAIHKHIKCPPIFTPLLLPSLYTKPFCRQNPYQYAGINHIASIYGSGPTRAFMHSASFSISQIGLEREDVILFQSVSLLLVRNHMDNVNIFSRPFFWYVCWSCIIAVLMSPKCWKVEFILLKCHSKKDSHSSRLNQIKWHINPTHSSAYFFPCSFIGSIKSVIFCRFDQMKASNSSPLHSHSFVCVKP